MHCLIFDDTAAGVAYRLLSDEPGATHTVFCLPDPGIVTQEFA